MNKEKVLIQNKKVRYEYFVETQYEAGIVLKGTEVKSLRNGKGNIKESYCYVKNNEIFISGMHISPYEQGNIFNVDPIRIRKLLLNKREIRKIKQNTTEEGYTILPLDLYLKNGKVKLTIAICKGKKLHDKRQSIAKKDAAKKILLGKKR